ncbi:protein-glutamate methylesterase/protein-glutamine glutaminase [Desulfoscipio gibsoniae]|uniref:Protein-glutamate methylesterase/protein-glutamine glutaminase n=1 Tax=Desulfoscipio gibsoniae DSM 7213 TaxID=767817 RepID=R4KME4_9FIRM|nr:chemotaxis response regulator protein-glutamate methylesterase [Desulfoscipio gibsoniae]AGL01705.1 chemotaxis response regulator containing a CheY-like receiver domain and a methylesterase domain [Desulfoscipio gibsoniae DSM 7213]
MPQPIKVLVVDDSALMRRVITRLLEAQVDIKVVDTAANGQEAIKKVTVLRPDVVTMDVEMPGMNGVATVTRLMRKCPVPVVMLSAHTTEGARVTMEALAAGAVDFVPKPLKAGDAEKMVRELAHKVQVASRAVMKRCPAPSVKPRPAGGHRVVDELAVASLPAAKPSPGKMELLAVGSSTGGPAALQVLLPALPGDLPCGVVVVQHIPVGFSGPMAEHLNRKCKLVVKHAEHGDQVLPGQVLVAPAGYDLTFRRYAGQLSIALDKGNKPVPPGGFRPSIDVMMNSAAEVVGNRTMGVLLTGMGRDGARGMLAIKQRGGYTIAQDESTCVVYGMPKAAAELGAARKILPLSQIAAEILRIV